MATLYSVGEDPDNKQYPSWKMNAAFERTAPKLFNSNRFIADGILCAGHAMYEHARYCKKRNKELEMARDTTTIYDGACLYNEFTGLPALKIILLPVYSVDNIILHLRIDLPV